MSREVEYEEVMTLRENEIPENLLIWKDFKLRESGFLFFASREYVDEVEEALLSATGYIQHLEQKMNQASDTFIIELARKQVSNLGDMQAEISQLKADVERYKSLSDECGDALKKNAILEAENIGLKHQVEVLTEIITDMKSKIDAKVVAMAESGELHAAKDEKGQLIPVDGISKKEKMVIAVVRTIAGWTPDAISDLFEGGVNVDTVKRYIRDAKGHYSTSEFLQRPVVDFDESLGGERYYTDDFTKVPD